MKLDGELHSTMSSASYYRILILRCQNASELCLMRSSISLKTSSLYFLWSLVRDKVVLFVGNSLGVVVVVVDVWRDLPIY